MKCKTNIFEIVLRQILIGKRIYDDAGDSIIISRLNYDPSVRCMYVTDGVKKFKIRVDDYFEFDYDDDSVLNNRILPGDPKKFKNK